MVGFRSGLAKLELDRTEVKLRGKELAYIDVEKSKWHSNERALGGRYLAI